MQTTKEKTLGGPSPTEAAGTGARVPAPELPHDKIVMAQIPMRDLARLLDLVSAATFGDFDQERISKAIDITGRYGFDLTELMSPSPAVVSEMDFLLGAPSEHDTETEAAMRVRVQRWRDILTGSASPFPLQRSVIIRETD